MKYLIFLLYTLVSLFCIAADINKGDVKAKDKDFDYKKDCKILDDAGIKENIFKEKKTVPEYYDLYPTMDNKDVFKAYWGLKYYAGLGYYEPNVPSMFVGITESSIQFLIPASKGKLIQIKKEIKKAKENLE